MSLADEVLGNWAPVVSGVELKPSNRGRFEVICDDEPVFRKSELKRFPERGEIVRLLEPRLGPALKWR